MGTRNLICIYYRAHFAVAQYAQHDGLPEGHGIDILNFLSDSQNIQRLKTGLQYVDIVGDDEEHDVEHIEAKFRPPSLSASTGCKILYLIANATADSRLPIVKELRFANDWISCEWAYVIDLDKSRFEVFSKHAPKSESGSQRFERVGERYDTVPRFLKSYDFAGLPSPDDFLEQMNAIEQQVLA